MSDAIPTLFMEIGEKAEGFYSAEEDRSIPPQIAWPLGVKIDDAATAAEIAAARSEMNPYRADDLLGSCLSRIANCISIREKAHEIQVRALLEGIELLAGETIETSKAKVEDILYPGPAVGNGKNDPGRLLRTHRDRLSKAKSASLEARREIAALPGSGSNFGERFGFLKSMFKINFLEAVSRGRLASDALAHIYSITLPDFPAIDIQPFLNELALWAQKVADLVDAEKDKRVRRKFVIPLKKVDTNNPEGLLVEADYNAQFAAGMFSFSLTDDFFTERGVSSPVIREFALRSLPGNPANFGNTFPAWITPPQPVLINSDRVLYQPAVGGGPEHADLLVSEEFFNLDPVGPWTIRHTKGAAIGNNYAVSDLPNFFIHLTVFGRR